MKTSILTTEQLTTLRESLPFGSITKIAEQTGLSRTFVSQTLNNKKRDTPGCEKVIETALDMLENRIELSQRADKLKQKAL